MLVSLEWRAFKGWCPSTLNPRVKVKHLTTRSRMVSGEAKTKMKWWRPSWKLWSLTWYPSLLQPTCGQAFDSFISLTFTFIQDWLLHNWIPFVRLPLYIILVCFSNKLNARHAFNMRSQAFPWAALCLYDCPSPGRYGEHLNLDSLPLAMYEVNGNASNMVFQNLLFSFLLIQATKNDCFAWIKSIQESNFSSSISATSTPSNLW